MGLDMNFLSTLGNGRIILVNLLISSATFGNHCQNIFINPGTLKAKNLTHLTQEKLAGIKIVLTVFPGGYNLKFRVGLCCPLL